MEGNQDFYNNLRSILLNSIEEATTEKQKSDLRVALAVLDEYKNQKASQDRVVVFFRIMTLILKATTEGSIIGFFASLGGGH